MMHIFLNGVGASAGAGLTYLYNVVPRLASLAGVRTTLVVQPQLREYFESLTNVTVARTAIPAGTFSRFGFEQTVLPSLIRESGADVLLSAGNFAVRRSPVPQILLSGNSLYTSQVFYRDLLHRGAYRMWLDTKIRGYLARKSVNWASCSVAPSKAFADELERWTGKHVEAVHHGFDPGVFFGDSSPLSLEVREKLNAATDCLKLLFVSHYNYYRNFETLFRAVARLRKRLPEYKVRLFLTCTLDDRRTPGAYKTGRAAKEIQRLGVRDQVVELGAIPYTQLNHVYRACDIYVTAAYAETFAHPLVEAMASGLRVIASDIPVHREVCRNNAMYFPAFAPEDLAGRILEMAQRSSQVVPNEVFERFSWTKHVQAILKLASRLTGGGEPISRMAKPALQSA